MKDKHQVGYSGADSMREKAKKLFGNAVEGVGMLDTPSASMPSRQPMRKYAKGGSVKREGAMLPKSAKGGVQGGTLTDMHMPKKDNAMKKGGKVKSCYKTGGSVDKVKMKEDRATMGSRLNEVFRDEKSLKSKTLKKPSSSVKELGVESKMKPGKTAPIPKNVEDNYKKGGSVKGTRANTTSTMRRTMKGRTKAAGDQTMKFGNGLDVGSVKELSTPKKASMLKPKAASNGNKRSKLNEESIPKMNGMRCGGKVKSKK